MHWFTTSLCTLQHPLQRTKSTITTFYFYSNSEINYFSNLALQWDMILFLTRRFEALLNKFNKEQNRFMTFSFLIKGFHFSSGKKKRTKTIRTSWNPFDFSLTVLRNMWCTLFMAVELAVWGRKKSGKQKFRIYSNLAMTRILNWISRYNPKLYRNNLYV